jgi:hypothetical protein
MASLPEVIGLLYRADWTRLSLSAELRFETDREPLPRLSDEEEHAALITVAAGARGRLRVRGQDVVHL